MSPSDPSPAGRTSLRRLSIWLLVAAAIAIGLVFFFRFGRDIAPVLGGGQ